MGMRLRRSAVFACPPSVDLNSIARERNRKQLSRRMKQYSGQHVYRLYRSPSHARGNCRCAAVARIGPLLGECGAVAHLGKAHPLICVVVQRQHVLAHTAANKGEPRQAGCRGLWPACRLGRDRVRKCPKQGVALAI